MWSRNGGRGFEFRTLSTAIFRGNGYNKVNGIDSRVSAAIPVSGSQHCLDCAKTLKRPGKFFSAAESTYIGGKKVACPNHSGCT
jgi:hypothetical protein